MRLSSVAVVVAFLFGGASQMHSQEKAADKSAASAPDAIAGAKKEFEGIKSARDGALLPKSGLPRVSVPQLSMPSATPSVGAKQKNVVPEAKSPNWLIEAMEKPERERELRGQNSRLRDRLRTSSSREKSLEGNDETSRESLRADDESEENAVFNPLTRYLGDWMTPQDYALLKPGLSVDAGMEVKSLTTFGPLDTVGNLPGAIGLKSGEFDLRTSTATLSAPRDNPFLQTLTPDLGMAPGPGATKPVALPPPMSPLPATIAPPPPMPPAQTKIPEFAKPPTDDRYFKQLKRF